MNSKTRFGSSRRALLKSLGASAALAPFLPILNASGQELVFPKRLLLFYSPDGTASIDDGGAALDWKPSGTTSTFTLASIHAPLEPHKSKLIVPYGLKMSAGGAGQEHAFGMAGLWTGASLNPASGDANFDGGNGNRTGWGSGPSIDQTIALATGADCPYSRPATDATQETPYRTLELGVQCLEPHSMHRMIYKGNNQPIHPETNPLAAFNRLFSSTPAGSPQMTDAATVRRRAQLELLIAQTQRLRTRVGSEEYAKIDAHLSGLQALQQRLGTTTPTVTGCSAALHLLERLVTGYGSDEKVTRALDTRTFYVVPRLNPDGAEIALSEQPRYVRSSVRKYPLPEREDGLQAEDVDGDGRILTMRLRDPNGNWKAHPDAPALMVRRDPDVAVGAVTTPPPRAPTAPRRRPAPRPRDPVAPRAP